MRPRRTHIFVSTYPSPNETSHTYFSVFLPLPPPELRGWYGAPFQSQNATFYFSAPCHITGSRCDKLFFFLYLSYNSPFLRTQSARKFISGCCLQARVLLLHQVPPLSSFLPDDRLIFYRDYQFKFLFRSREECTLSPHPRVIFPILLMKWRCFGAQINYSLARHISKRTPPFSFLV